MKVNSFGAYKRDFRIVCWIYQIIKSWNHQVIEACILFLVIISLVIKLSFIFS